MRGVTVWIRLVAGLNLGPDLPRLDFGTCSAMDSGGSGRMQTARTALVLIGLGFFVGCLSAQTTTDAAAAMGNAGVAAEATKATPLSDSRSSSRHIASSRFAAPASSKTGASGPLVAPSGPPADEVNRKKFEENAGKDAGKVLLRSVPSGASIFLNHMLVGHAPLLLFLAPGRYEVEMRGEREESGHRVLVVIPKRTQSMVIDMSERYPPSVSLHWH
jgi:PEGA domain